MKKNHAPIIVGENRLERLISYRVVPSIKPINYADQLHKDMSLVEGSAECAATSQ